MARIRSSGNKDTELRLVDLMRAAGLRGWRRGATLCFAAKGKAARGKSAVKSPGSKVKDPGNQTGFPRPARDRGRRPLTCDLRPSTRAAPRRVTTRPDFVFPRAKLAVFVDGCFWHGCPRHVTWPKANAAFWREKIEGNLARDRRADRTLRAAGWRVLRIWEHALVPRAAARTLARLHRALGS